MEKFFDDHKRNFLAAVGGMIFFIVLGLGVMMFTGENKPTENFSAPQTQKQSQISREKNIFVYVTGAVKNPGVYEVSQNARIFNAIELAGGLAARADEVSLNLAEPLADGMHVHVEAKTPQEKASQKITQPEITLATQKNQSGLVDVNHASAKELEQLTGVGPAISKRIVEYRNAHGNFARPEDLLKIKGIGEIKLKKMRPQILIR